jgi:hypothetical protein
MVDKPSLGPGTGAIGMFLSQVLQNETSQRQDLLSRLWKSGDLPNGKHPQIDLGIRDFYDQL